MIVLSIGTDRKIFEQGSASRARMIEYGALFKELHIIVFSLKKHNLKAEKIADNVWIYPTNSRNRFFYPFDARKVFKKQMKDLKPDVITTQDPFETGVAGLLLRRKTHAKLHMQIHTDFMSKYFIHNSFLNRVRVMMAYWILPKANAIRAVSDRIRKSLVVINEALPAKTTVLPIYTDTDRFRNDPLKLDLHKQYSQFSFIIVMASRLNHEKNIKFALEIMRELVIRDPKVGLIIVGDGPEKRYLQALALRYHLDRNVVFESWQPDLVSYYRTADVFLSTSLFEGYGLTLVEAAAAGCPIVSSDVGIARQLIEDGVNGYVCDVNDQTCFVEKLLGLIQNEETRKTLKEQADIIADKKISIPKAEYLKLYKESMEQALH